jgi:hypothetical protein
MTAMPPPQATGHPPPLTLPFANVKPVMSVVLVMLAPVTVMTRWPLTARMVVELAPAPSRLTALFNVTLSL